MTATSLSTKTCEASVRASLVADPQNAFTSHGHLKPEQETDRLRKGSVRLRPMQESWNVH